MTPRQTALARHALGLDGHQKRSYRNRYFTHEWNRDYHTWLRMVRDGNATSHPLKGAGSRRVVFCLTLEGATAVLKKGESLDPEDFPGQPDCQIKLLETDA